MTVSPIRWKLMVLRSRLVNTAQIALRAPRIYRNWIYFLWSRFSDREGILVLRNGLRFWIRAHSTDRAAITEVLVLDCYSQVPEGSLVVDVGASLCCWLHRFLLCSALAWPAWLLAKIRAHPRPRRARVKVRVRVWDNTWDAVP